jgi:Fic family protein
MAMERLAKNISDGIAALDEAGRLPNAQLSPNEKVLFAVVFACRVFETFLRVHPFANGNGHAARFLIWAILGRYGYWPTNWPIEPRPPDPPYTNLIMMHRNGNREPLERFVLQCIARSD